MKVFIFLALLFGLVTVGFADKHKKLQVEDAPDDEAGEGDVGADEGDEGTDEGDDGADEGDDGADEGDDGTDEGDVGADEGDDGTDEGDDEGDDGTDEGDDGTDEGDDGADEGDDGADEGDDGTDEGDDGTDEGDSEVAGEGEVSPELVLVTSGSTLLSLVKESKTHTILMSLLESLSDVSDLLQSVGPFTFFAPNDDAFNRIPADTLESWKGDMDSLKQILSYHVVQGTYRIRDLEKCQMLETAEDSEMVLVRRDSAGVSLNDMARTVDNMVDKKVTNGVLHAIDYPLVPVSMWDCGSKMGTQCLLSHGCKLRMSGKCRSTKHVCPRREYTKEMEKSIEASMEASVKLSKSISKSMYKSMDANPSASPEETDDQAEETDDQAEETTEPEETYSEEADEDSDN